MGAMLNNESIVNTIEKSIPSFVGLVPTKELLLLNMQNQKISFLLLFMPRRINSFLYLKILI